jgi:hypothetical protein
MVKEISIVVRYERHPDGCYYLRSDTLTGFRMEGPDIDALQRDLDPIVSDLLLHNHGFEVESIRWVPSPDEVKQHLERPSSGVVTYVARLKAAA